ncbi:ECF RNA polymerase sigma factor SigW [Poriferisphaera corsica]|uniref:ECF RNA polymerase sigma factor SigW n=1 Tax=Poriferisphaera corsica TaxID=2528020 RepID=A0A517YWW2_9BACT|nr:sigma-70 family RNA polymerase sigma factor [Poriferisphaera corsica]QDU34711.1 ECF RNA polymerase sigma factor SigW [Poriferisphaera corsica]
MTQVSEREIISQIKKGNQAALGSLLKSQQTRLFNVCLRMVGNRDDAAEVTQETFLKVIANISKYRGDAKLTTWMTRIAINQSISFLRKRKYRLVVSLDEPRGTSGGGSGYDDQATALRAQIADDREPGPELSVEKKEMLGKLQEAMGDLEEEFRAILILRDIEQMEYKQIADVLHLPQGTVKSRLFRARLALREAMQKRCSDEKSDRGAMSGAAGQGEVQHD